MKYLAILSILILTGCASISETQQKAADFAFGAVTSAECRLVRATAIKNQSAEEWPDVSWSAVDSALLSMKNAADAAALDRAAGVYAAQMLLAVSPHFLESGMIAKEALDKATAEGWTINSFLSLAQTVMGEAKFSLRVLAVRAAVEECENAG